MIWPINNITIFLDYKIFLRCILRYFEISCKSLYNSVLLFLFGLIPLLVLQHLLALFVIVSASFPLVLSLLKLTKLINKFSYTNLKLFVFFMLLPFSAPGMLYHWDSWCLMKSITKLFYLSRKTVDLLTSRERKMCSRTHSDVTDQIIF